MKMKLTALALLLVSILPLAFTADRRLLQSSTQAEVLDVLGRPVYTRQPLFFFPANPPQVPRLNSLDISPRNSSRPFCFFNLASSQGFQIGAPFFFRPLRGGSDNVIRVSSPLSILLDGSVPDFCPRDNFWRTERTTVAGNSYDLVVVDGAIRPTPGTTTTYFQVERVEGATSNLYRFEYIVEIIGVIEPIIQRYNVGLNVVGDRELLMVGVEPTPFEIVPFVRSAAESAESM